MQYKKHYIRWMLSSMMTLQIFAALAQTEAGSTTDAALEQWMKKWMSTGNVQLSHFCSVTDQDVIGKKETFSATLRPSKELMLHIPESYQQIDQYGNTYILAYLYNFTDTVVTLLRFDDALGIVQHYFKPKATWIQSTPPPVGLCGNGIWTQSLLPNHYLRLKIESHSLLKGDKSIPYKIMLQINENLVIASRPVDVKLMGSQINALTQTITPDNTPH
jgi:hypothetical protein